MFEKERIILLYKDNPKKIISFLLLMILITTYILMYINISVTNHKVSNKVETFFEKRNRLKKENSSEDNFHQSRDEWFYQGIKH